ncbi:MAG: ABC transporter substrate-binding protein, partial [Acidobacteria bacterium]|nr:ABC transporter substrate-binding protein [Acidobacteriota bacterium]
GLFQGNVDAMNAYAKWVNANGGVGCRQLKVIAWDSKLSPEESKNGIINACQNALAMVGGNSLFNPDVSVLKSCADKAGNATGLPNFAALANDINEQCAANTWIIQAVAETCPADGSAPKGPRDLKVFVGANKYYVKTVPDSKGIWLIPGDLPTTVQSATYQVQGARDTGINVYDAFKVGGSMQQSAYTPFVQSLKDNSGNFVYNGSADTAMIKMRKETAAQGYSGVQTWACSLACYTDKFKAEGATVDNTYVWFQFLPFEEASSNANLKAYIDSVGGKPDSFGMQAWQAGMLFKETIDRIVAADGPNAITRANVLKTMFTITDFTAGGTMGAKSAKGFSNCFVMMQIKGGSFTRVNGKPGEFVCDPSNVMTISNFDPAAEAAKVR